MRRPGCFDGRVGVCMCALPASTHSPKPVLQNQFCKEDGADVSEKTERALWRSAVIGGHQAESTGCACAETRRL